MVKIKSLPKIIYTPEFYEASTAQVIPVPKFWKMKVAKLDTLLAQFSPACDSDVISPSNWTLKQSLEWLTDRYNDPTTSVKVMLIMNALHETFTKLNPDEYVSKESAED